MSAASQSDSGAEDATRPIVRSVVESTVVERLSRYVALEEIGRGGMGRVLRAYDPKLQREVALKEVHRDALDDEAAKRLVAEARAMAKLSHPSVVAICDVEELEGGEVVLVMEYVAGQTLKAWLRAETRDWRSVVDAFVTAGRGLHAAHDAGLLHRDFKPANVLVSDGDAVKVTDFGIAKVSGAPSRGPSFETEISGDDLELTAAGSVMGTPRYMAPEQHVGDPLTAAADQYAFCVALWEGLCGEPPFRGKTISSDKSKGPPAWPERSTPRPVVEAIERGLSPQPEARWPNMEALLGALDWDPQRRRKRVLLGLTGIATLGLAGLGYDAWAGAGAERCSGAEQRLRGVWDDERRAAVTSAFTAVDKAYASAALDKTVTDLDRYAEAWSAMHVEACEATAVRKEQSAAMLDLRMACLDRAVVDLDATVDVLTDADAEVIQKAHRIIGGLRPLYRCADREALSADVEPPMPEEADQVAATRLALARAEALGDAGRYDDAKEAVADARASLGDAQYGPVRTELALAEGRALNELGEYEAAVVQLEEAIRLGQRWGPRASLFEAVSDWMFVVGYRLQEMKRALLLRPVAEGLAEEGTALEARYRSRLGLVLDLEGDYEESEAQHRRALALRESVLGPKHSEVAISRANLGLVLDSQGRYPEAEAQHRAAVRLLQETLGAAHPSTAASHSNLGSVLIAQGKYTEAEEEIRLALAIREDALGPEHPHMITTRNNLGIVLFNRGRLAEAEVEHRTVLDLSIRLLGSDHPKVATARTNLANVLAVRQDYAGAGVEYRAALVAHEAALGPNHIMTALAHNNLAHALRAQGSSADAESEHRAALAAAEAALDPEHPRLAGIREDLGDLLLAQRRLDEALVYAKGAWDRRRRDDTPPASRAEAAFLLARILWEIEGPDRDRARAVQLAEDARTSYEAAEESSEATEVQRWIEGRSSSNHPRTTTAE